MNSLRSRIIISALIGAGLSVSTPAHAVTRLWTGSGDGVSWVLNTNWSTNTVPLAGDLAQIDIVNGPLLSTAVTIDSLGVGYASGTTGSAEVSGSSASITANNVYMGQSGTGELNITNGAQVQVAQNVFMGWNATGSGTINISGPGSKLTASNQIQVGRIGAGEVNLSDGGHMHAASTIFVGGTGNGPGVVNLNSNSKLTTDISLVIAGGALGSGSVIVNNSTVSVKSSIRVGNVGEGSIHILGGGYVHTQDGLYMAYDVGSTSIVTLTDADSSMYIEKQIQVGRNGSAELHITNGADVYGVGTMYSGMYANSYGLINVDNATLRGDGSLYIGRDANSLGEVRVSGADASVTLGGLISVGRDGIGELNISNGAKVHSVGDVYISNNDGGDGTVSVSNGAELKTDGIIRIAQSQATSKGVLIIGGQAGQAATAAGTVIAQQILFGAGSGSVVFNHTSDHYEFDVDIEGNGTLQFISGTTVLTGDSSLFSGDLSVGANARVYVNGIVSAVQTVVEDQAWLLGSGTMGEIIVRSGGGVAPGNSIGILTVTDATFESGSLYQVEIDSTGNSDLINASGTVTLQGGRVLVIPYPDYDPSRTYTIITALGGVNGSFDIAESAAPFLNVTLSQDFNNVYLTVTPSIFSNQSASVANTYNRSHVLAAMQSMPISNVPLQTLLASPNNATAQAYLDMFSGEIHPGIANGLIAQQDMVRKAAFTREGRMQVSNAAGDQSLWLQMNGTRRISDSSNVAELKTQSVNTMIGLEKEVKTRIFSRIGVAVGHTSSWFDAAQQRGDADAQSYHGMVYGDKEIGPISLRSGMSYSWHDIDTKRNVSAGTLQDVSKSDYNASTVQVFTEAVHEMPINAQTKAKPYINLAYVQHHSDSFSEDGAAGLHGDSETRRIGSTTAGFNVVHDLETREETGKLQLQGGVGYRYQVGDVNGKTTHSFNDVPNVAFDVKGAPLDRHALILNAGIAHKYNHKMSTRLAYEGAFAGQSTQHSLIGQIKWAF